MANSRNHNNLSKWMLNVVEKNIKKYRIESNLSRQSLSNKMIMIGVDVPSNSIYEIETGKRTVADYELCAICKVLKIPVEYVIKDYYKSLDNV